MIEISPSGELAAITIPMDKQLLLKFSSICQNQLSMTPEEAVRKTVWQVVIQDAQRRKNP